MEVTPELQSNIIFVVFAVTTYTGAIASYLSLKSNLTNTIDRVDEIEKSQTKQTSKLETKIDKLLTNSSNMQQDIAVMKVTLTEGHQRNREEIEELKKKLAK